MNDQVHLDHYIYDWNLSEGHQFPNVEVDDETLRDGLQSPSVREPSLDQKIEILESIKSKGVI